MGRLNNGGYMKKRKKNNKTNNNIYIILFFFLLLSYYELNSNYSFGGIIRDTLFITTRQKHNGLLLNSLQNEIINENNELKKYLNLDKSLSDFDIVYSTIVERNNSFWLDELTINIGTIDNISKNMIVVSDNGVIGIIKNSSLYTSKVKLITANNTKIFVTINELYKVLSVENNKLIIKGINSKDNINIGDKVLTSGLSDNYPKGLIIGEIKSINKNKDGVGFTAEVEPSSNINNLRFVAVLRRKIK